MNISFNEWWLANKNRIFKDLKSYIDIDTVTPNEHNAYTFLKDYLSSVGFQIKKEYLNSEIKAHNSFTKHPLSHIDKSRFNVRAQLIGKENKVKTLFNCHIDVVPCVEGEFDKAFNSVRRGNEIIGRGACDTKNNLIMLVESIRYLRESNIEIKKDIFLDLVIEEEIGGNGTLSTILNGVDVDEVIVLEPTDLNVYRGHRGCLTFEINLLGKSVHMGSDTTGVSAIDCAIEVINDLKILEKELLKNAKSNPDFNVWPKALQVNIGILQGGEWSGSVPEKCKIIGDIGYLPTFSREEIMQKIMDICKLSKNEWIRNNFTVKFNGLKNDAYIIPFDSSLVKNFLYILNKHGVNQKDSYGWKVSCDARLYNKLLDLPTIVFGSGSLDYAHSSNEKVNIEEIQKGSAILVDFLKEDFT